MQNTGFIYQDPAPEDFHFGGVRSLDAKYAGRKVLCPDGDWTRWLPVTENQSANIETQGCVSFGTLNAIETLRKCLYDKTDNLADRFVVVGSGTNPQGGNLPVTVAEFIRQNWSVFENEYPFVDNLTEYYKKIPNPLYVLAESRGTQYEFGYEHVDLANIRTALQYSPVCMSVPAWSLDETNRYYRPEGMSDNHWVMCFAMQPNGDYLIFDTYYPFIKQVRADVKPMTRMGYHLNLASVNKDAWSAWITRVYQWFLIKSASWTK